MAEPLAWLTFILVGPLVLLLPGLLVLRLSPLASMREDPEEETVYETVVLSGIVSLALLVLIAFVLTQTVGLTRASLMVVYAALLAGLGALAWRRSGEEGWSLRPASRGGGPEPIRRPSLVVLGGVLLLVAAGGLFYDGGEAYTEVYHANASQTPATYDAGRGQNVSMTVIIENHEDAWTSYRVETRLVPEGTENETATSGTLVDQAELELADGESAQHAITFQVPDCCTWKVKTLVHVDGGQDPLVVHRWIDVFPHPG